MPTAIDSRRKTEAAVQRFGKQPLRQAALGLLDDLGYRSQLELKISGVDAFRSELDQDGRLNPEQAHLDEWKNVEFLRQVTGRDLSPTGELFRHDYDPSEIQSYVFLAIDLKDERYTRNKLSQISRAVNRIFMMPALLIFKHGESLTFSVVNRRLNKRDQSRDVLEKVTLIKDISTEEPLRAHTEILTDLSLEPLRQEAGFRDFEGLHAAWTKKLSSYALNERFYREISDWYFWSRHLVEEGAIKLPLHCDTEQEKSLFLIRLLTRLIFCWFLVEKKLLPSSLFRPHALEKLLKDLSDESSTYYHAILQNLFFGTLNMPLNQRGFREKKKEGERYDKNYGITNLWRYEKDFRDPAKWVEICRHIPFLNGGLFDCLDDKSGKKQDNFILDGFSDRADFGCHLPNELFFGGERAVDLSKDYGEENKRTARSKRAGVSGLIEILTRYKFTIEENTPLEEEIALDPELLGKVFENLLASYNEDTKTTARKALGAFYTPREIVSYMVDESLKSYLVTKVPRCKGALEDLFSNKATLKEIKPDTREALIRAIGQVKILDPACGSGAFPMGALHRLVDLLQKLDPNNESWKRDRLAEVRRYREILADAGASKGEIDACDTRIADIEKSFDTRFHALDYARKLFLIENCIFGVDIQPIATQIAKLRFFISLIVDQKADSRADNLGVRPLPNLETRIVAADTLVPIEKADSDLLTGELDKLRAELATIRHEHFSARNPAAKRKWREADEAKREEIAALLQKNHALPKESAKFLAGWDPYDQNNFAPFFDSEWMFGLPIGSIRRDTKSSATLLGNMSLINETGGQTELSASIETTIESGFDVIISNPPYRKERDSRKLFEKVAATAWGRKHQESKMDFWFYFMHRSLDLVRPDAAIVFITSRYWIESSGAGKLINRIAKEVSPLCVVDIGKLRVFDNVAGHHMIHLYQRGRGPGSTTVKRLKDDLTGLNAIRSAQNVEVSTRPSSELFEETGRVRLYASQLTIPSNRKLGEVFRVSQGVVQNPDKVNRKNAEKFRLHQGEGVFVVTDDELKQMSLTKSEMRFVKPFYDESDIRRFYALKPSSHLLYLTKGNCPSIASFPNIKRHLSKFRPIMAERRETVNGTNMWFHLHWPRDESMFEGPHIIFPSMFTKPSAAIFTTAAYAGLGSNVIVGTSPKADLLALACLLNSSVSMFWWKENGKQRGAGLDVGVDRLRGFPLPLTMPGSSQLAQLATISSLLALCDCSLSAEGEKSGTRDLIMLGYWEQILNGFVYELYFPDEVHGAGVHVFDLFKQANMPEAKVVAEQEKITAVRKKFEELHDGTHPLRQALDKLQTLDTVRIIEGKA